MEPALGTGDLVESSHAVDPDTLAGDDERHGVGTVVLDAAWRGVIGADDDERVRQPCKRCKRKIDLLDERHLRTGVPVVAGFVRALDVDKDKVR